MKPLFSIFLVILFVIAGCSSSHPNFTKENIMKLRTGMSDREVIAIFGYPDKTEASTCGQLLGRPWKCIKWKYHFGLNDYSWNYHVLTFQEEDGRLYLNSWDIR